MTDNILNFNPNKKVMSSTSVLATGDNQKDPKGNNSNGFLGVRLVRFVTGEDVLAEVTLKDYATALKNPLLVQIIQTPNSGGQGRVGLGTVDWLPLMEGNEVEVNGQTIVAIYTPNKTLVDQYEKTFNNRAPSIIQPVKAPLIGLQPSNNN